MIDERTIELIHAGIDGELDAAGAAELEQCLADSGEARQYHAQMRDLGAFMSRVPVVEPPEGLHASIVSSIGLPRPRAAWRFGQFPGFLRYGLATAAGLLLAIGLYEYRPGMGGSADLSSMVGTIMPGRNPADGVRLDGFDFSLEGLASEVSLLRRDQQLVLDVRMQSPGPVSVAVAFDGEALQFEALAQSESELQSIEIDEGAIRVEASGAQHFAVLLHVQDAAAMNAGRIDLRWYSEGQVLKQGEVKFD